MKRVHELWCSRSTSIFMLLGLVVTAGALAPARAGQSVEPVATFSIVGRDPATGDLGIAVQSRFFAVGAVVPWARAGVGAIATQAFANTTYGPEGLRLLAEGLDPAGVVSRLTAPDEQRESRQIGIVDATGASTSYTGTECMAWAGGVSGPGFAAQGNILVSQATVDAMARAFEASEGMLGERLMRSLEEGQRAGGDSRGVQSAAILIVRDGGGYAGYNDRYCDLRVDDDTDPIGELRRLFDMWKWHALVNDGYTACEQEDWDRALAIGAELIALEPGTGESYYHPACFYAKAGRRSEALEHLAEAIRRDGSLAGRARLDPDFKSLYGDADFDRLTDTNVDSPRSE